jgi:hypothetical protein
MVHLRVEVISMESTRGLYALESELTCLQEVAPVICEMNHLYEDHILLQDLCKRVWVCSLAIADQHVNVVATYEPDGADIVATVHTKEWNLALNPLSLSK